MNVDPGAEVLTVEDVSVDFRRRRRDPVVRALDGVSMSIPRGTTAGLVGESGSGKSTLAKAVLGLVPVTHGKISVAGQVVGDHPDHKALAKHVQAVFQDPSGALNPSYTVGRSIAEPLLAQRRGAPKDIDQRVSEALERVGLGADAASRRPSEFSGGQRQRICIARALMTEPDLIVLDEAVSALDLSVQAQVLNLLADLQDSTRTSYLFISHDMNVVRRTCDHVTVLYRGRVMESGPTDRVTATPAHPYTRALLLASPVADPAEQTRRRQIRVAETIAAPVTELGADSCPFTARCPFARPECSASRPPLRDVGNGVKVACHRFPEWRAEDSAGVSNLHIEPVTALDATTAHPQEDLA